MADSESKHIRKILSAVCAATLIAASSTTAVAQARPVAVKTMDISAFGGFQYSKPDFGPFDNTGGTIGVNITRYMHFPVAPSLEVRGNYSTGDAITEKSLLAGLRGQIDFHERFHPYVDFLFGGGSIRYDHLLGPNYHPDRGTVLSYGAGVDIDAIKHFQVKLDVQSQSWNLGPNATTKPAGGDYSLSPILVVAGIAYRLPAGPRNHY